MGVRLEERVFLLQMCPYFTTADDSIAKCVKTTWKMLHFQQQHGGAGQQQLYKPLWCSICSPSPCNVQDSLMRATGRQLHSQPNNTEGGVMSWGGGAAFSASPRLFRQVFSSPRRHVRAHVSRTDLI